MTIPAATLAFATLALCAAAPPQGAPYVPNPYPAAPQGGNPSGLLLGSPLGITTKLQPDIAIKLAGFAPVLPPPVPRPAFELLVDTILASLPGVAPSGEAPILAMSLGIDVIIPEFGDTGILDGANVTNTPMANLTVGNHGWYAIEFSVDGGQVGQQQGQLAPDIAAAIQDEDVDRSVFTYVLPESSLWPSLLPSEQESVRCLTPASLGLLDPTDEIHGLNLHMGLYDTDLTLYPKVFTVRPLPPAPFVFFTLRPEFAKPNVMAAINATWGEGSDSGTIFRTQWVDGGWIKPQPYRNSHQLGLMSAGQKLPPIIDGLAIDTHLDANDEDDFIMLSLADTASRPVPAELQVMLRTFGDPPGNPPRRVVVRIGGSYHSLGKVLKAGRGVGDICAGDPWARGGVTADAVVKIDSGSLSSGFAGSGGNFVSAVANGSTGTPPNLQTDFAPDDFLVARRMPHDDPKSGTLALAVAAYRQYHGGPFVRACLSWPDQKSTSGDVTVHFGTIEDITDPTVPPKYKWDPTPQHLHYMGKPLTIDLKLPVSTLMVAVPPPTAARTCAFVVKWEVRVQGKTYISPVAALRF